MLKTLQLKELFIGKTDAKNELIENRIEEQNLFCNSFLVPDNINIDDFYNGKRYFITGFKGTGKTALLHYLDLNMKKNNDYTSSFILFKTDFTDDDKSTFSKAANTAYAVNNSEENTFDEYTSIWQWFLHRQIVVNSEKHYIGFFNKDKHWERYRNCVLAPNVENEKSGIMKLFPKVKRGSIEISADAICMNSKIGLEFDWENKDTKQVKFANIIKQANELYKKLTPTNVKAYIYIDELELSLTKQKQYQKDIHLIRDLIISIYRLNTLSKSCRYNIHIISALRSEVLTAINSIGKEINKPIIDFGVTLKWQQSGGNIDEHPLIKMINKKIQSTELYYKIPVTSEVNIWDKYFTKQINGHPIKEYILHRTWYRPRDIVRLLNIAQQQFPNECKFSQFVFDAINKEYSTQSWIEHTEELGALYSVEEIEGIKRVLMALKCPFTFHQIQEKCEETRKVYSPVDKLLNKHKLGDLLSHLYNIGIIGNTGANVRYSFRGDDGLVIENRMKIHDPLWSYLSIEYRE